MTATLNDQQKACIRALFQTNPPDELGPTDEPESQYRFGYNTALEDVLNALDVIDALNAKDSQGEPVAQWQSKLIDPILPECDVWLNVSEEGAKTTREKYSHVYRVRALYERPLPCASDALAHRQAIEAAQRERMNARFANRVPTPATADFDLPAPNDAVPCYQCKGCGDNDAAPGHCVRCGGTGLESASDAPAEVRVCAITDVECSRGCGKVCALDSAPATSASAESFEGPVSIHRTHPNQAYVTFGFDSEEQCTQFIKATRCGSSRAPTPAATAPAALTDAHKPLGYINQYALRCLLGNATAVVSPEGMRDPDETIPVYLATNPSNSADAGEGS